MASLRKKTVVHFAKISLSILLNLPFFLTHAAEQSSKASLPIHGVAPTTSTPLSVTKAQGAVLKDEDTILSSFRTLNDAVYDAVIDGYEIRQNYFDEDGDVYDLTNGYRLMNAYDEDEGGPKKRVQRFWRYENGELLTAEELNLPTSAFEGQTLTLQLTGVLELRSKTGLPKRNEIPLESKLYKIKVVKERDPSIEVNGTNYRIQENGFPRNGFANAHFDFVTPYEASEYDWTITTSDGSTTDFISVDTTTGRVTLLKSPKRYVTVTIEANAKADTEAAAYSINKLVHSFRMTRWFEYVPDALNATQAAEYCVNNLSSKHELVSTSSLLSDAREGYEPRRTDYSNILWSNWGNLTQYGWPKANFFTAETQSNGFDVINSETGLRKRLALTDKETYTAPFVCTQFIDGTVPVPSTTPVIKNLTLSGEFKPGQSLKVSYDFISNSPNSNEDHSEYAFGQANYTNSYPNKLNIDSRYIYNHGKVEDTLANQFVLPPITDAMMNQIVELSIKPINDIGSEGEIVVIKSSDSYTMGNQLSFTPAMIVNGIRFPLRDNAIENAFKGAKYRLVLPKGMGSYQHSINDSNIKFDGTTGEIEFNNRISTIAPITISSRDRQTQEVFTHMITVKRWIEFSDINYITGYFPTSSGYSPNTASNNPASYCSISYPGSFPLKSKFIFQAPAVSGEYGVDEENNTTRALNGGLLNEWGNLNQSVYSKVVMPSVLWGTTKNGDSRGKFLTTGQTEFKESLTSVSQSAAVACYYNNDPTISPDVPEITSLKLTGDIKLGSYLTASYVFEGNSDEDASNQSLYSYGYKDQTIQNKGKVNESLITSTNTVIKHAAVPYSANNTFTLPTITSAHINKVLELSMQPINGAMVKGKIVTIDTEMSEANGNFSKKDTQLLVNNHSFNLGDTFPTTAFARASFRLSLPTGIQNYDLSIENGDNAVEVDQNTGVVVFKSPVLDKRTIKVVAVGKSDTTEAGKRYEHAFKLLHWYESTKFKPTTQFTVSNGYHVGDEKFEADNPRNNPEALCRNYADGARLANSFMLRNPSDTAAGKLNGTLNGEWGNITYSTYKDSGITSDGFWLMESTTTTRKVINYGLPSGWTISSLTKDNSYAALCDLMPVETNSKPKISNLRLSGTVGDGQKLIATYDFDSGIAGDDRDYSVYYFSREGAAVNAPNTASATLLGQTSVIKNSLGQLELPALSAKDINSFVELAIQPVNSTLQSGDIVSVNSLMNPDEGNELIMPPGITVNSINYDLNSNFPSIGFEGGRFKLLTKYAPKNYSWQVEGVADEIVVDGQLGLVTLTKPILNRPQVTIRAIGKAGTVAAGLEHAHTFNLIYWVAPSVDSVRGWQLGDANYNIEDTLSSADLWCEKAYPNSEVLSENIYSTRGNTSSLVRTSLITSWGVIRKDIFPNTKFYDNTSYWLKEVSSENSRSLGVNLTGSTTTETKARFYPTICLLNPLDNTNKPKIRNLTLTGEVGLNKQLTLSYDFEANTPFAGDFSEYSLDGRVTEKGTAFESLNSPIQLTRTADGKLLLPAFNQFDLNRVHSIYIQPINAIGTRGEIASVSTTMTKEEGNRTTYEPGVIINKKLFIGDNKLPRSAFAGAYFTLIGEYHSSLYDWSAENIKSDEISFGSDGLVTLLKPILDGREIKIVRTGKPNTVTAGQVKTTVLPIQRWFEGGDPVAGYFPTDTGYSATDKTNNPENYCRLTFPGSVPITNDMYSTGVKEVRELNGRLVNEWGYIDNDSYPKNLIYKYPGFRVVGQYLLTQNSQPPARYLSLGDSEADIAAYAATSSGSSYMYRTICLLNPQPVGQVPVVKDLTLMGKASLGQSLTFSYNFVGASGVEDESLYSYGIKGLTPIISNQTVNKDEKGLMTLPPITENLLNRTLELSVQPVDSNLTYGQIVRVDTQMTFEQGNQVQKPPRLVVNGYTFPIGSEFPKVAYKGASFIMGTYGKPTDYDWEVINGEGKVTVNGNTGEVTFVEPYYASQTIEIKAIGKAGTEAEGDTLMHPINITSWVDFSSTGDIIGSQIQANNQTADRWCQINYPNSQVMPVKQFVASGTSATIPANSENRLDDNALPGRSPIGGLLNQWGALKSLSGLKDTGNDPVFWLQEFNSTGRYYASSTGVRNQASANRINVMCQTVFGETIAAKPRIENIKLYRSEDGKDALLSYDLISSDGQVGKDNSFAAVGSLNTTTSGEKENKIITVGSRYQVASTSGAKSIINLTQQLNAKEVEIAIQPVDSQNRYGDVVVINTMMSSLEGNFITRDPALIGSDYRFKIDSGFPRSGFDGAQFSILPEFGARNYEWRVENPSKHVDFDVNSMTVTLKGLMVEPETVTIKGTGKAGTIAEGKTTVVPINVENWFVKTEPTVGFMVQNNKPPFLASQSQPKLLCQEIGEGYDLAKIDQYYATLGRLERKPSGIFLDEWVISESIGIENPMVIFGESWLMNNDQDNGLVIANNSRNNLPSFRLVSDKSTGEKEIPAICIKTLTDKSTFKKPEIRNLKLKGKMNSFEPITAEFDYFDPNDTNDKNLTLSLYVSRDIVAGKTINNTLGTGFNGIKYESGVKVIDGKVNVGLINIPPYQQQETNKIYTFTFYLRDGNRQVTDPVTIDTTMSIEQGNEVIQTPGIILGGAESLMRFEYNAPAPQNIIPSGHFRIQGTHGGQNYNWSVEQGSQFVAIDKAGIVTFKKPIYSTQQISIKGVGKSGTPVENETIVHTFEAKRWVEYSESVDCSLLGSAVPLPANLFSTSLLNATYVPDGRVTNGLLWHEWGDPLSGDFSRDYVLGNSFTGTGVVIGGGYTGVITDGTQDYFYLCQLIEPNVATKKPEIRNLVIEKDTTGKNLIVTYEFISNSSNPVDNSSYVVGLKNSLTTTNVNSGEITFFEAFPSKVSNQDRRIVIPYEEFSFYEDVYEFAIIPLNAEGVRGDMVRIDSSMSYEQGNHITNLSPVLVNKAGEYPLGSDFPVNAFNYAQFRILTPYPTANYDWLIENNEGSLFFDEQEGRFTFVKQPIEPIMVTITGKPGTISQNERYTHTIQPKKWISTVDNVKGYYPEMKYTSISVLDMINPLSTPESACEFVRSSSRPMLINEYINASPVSDEEKKGLFYNEWDVKYTNSYLGNTLIDKDKQIDTRAIIKSDNSTSYVSDLNVSRKAICVKDLN